MVSVVREAVVDNPQVTYRHLTALLEDRGLTANSSTVHSLRSDTRLVLRLLARKGLLVQDYARSLNGAAAE